MPEILFVLHSLLDDDRYIVLAEKNGEIVKPHKNFRLFASMNPSGSYTGTKELNKAFLSRFPIILNVKYPTKANEIKILKQYTKMSNNKIENLRQMAQDIRKAYNKNEINYSNACFSG